MKDISPELKELLLKYHGDEKRALKEESNPDYFFALSVIRENVLEWYEFNPDASLLEVGSGCGALTGLFARRVREVTVLDDREDNLEVNRMRHGAHSNIRYVKGSLADCQEGSFDYVVMVGSLKEPFEANVDRAKSLLKPNGTLILAADNRLGIKYRAGAKPDETSLLRKEMAALLCGKNGEKGGTIQWYYPMPDYRLPATIYSEEYLPVKGELTHAILAYDYPEYLKFDPGRMYDEICEAELFEEFANSFLAIWSSHEKDEVY